LVCGIIQVRLGVIRIKKLLPIIIVLAILGGGAYLYFNQGTSDKGGIKEAVQEQFEGSLETAVSKGIPVKCEWEDEDAKVTTYIKDGKIYSETLSEGKMQYAIVNDNCTWTWDEKGEQAVKYCFEEIDYTDLDPAAVEETSMPEGMESQTQEEETADYNCVPTVVSDDKFDPPSDVNFMSF
jgi:hypothetical protein